MISQLPHSRTRLALVVLASIAALLGSILPVVAAGEGTRETARSLARPHAKDRVIVGFKPGASRVKRRSAVTSVGPVSVDAVSPIASDVVVVELPPGRSVASAIAEIGDLPGVAYVEPDYWVQAAATPDDTYYTAGDHWGMYGDATSPHANPYGSGAGEAWARGQTGASSVFVGVIDEGIKTTHPDLAANVWSNPWETVNGVDDDGNGYVDDINGWDFYNDDASVYDGTGDDHGTHVTGTIGARGGNGTGVAGVNWRVTLISAKFLGARGGFTGDAIRAIDYITDLKTRHGLDVVATNNSWSGGSYSQALLDAIDRAGDAGILFVVAAGNDGRDIDTVPAYPAAYQCDTRANGNARGWDCLISVANIESDGDKRSDSNWGATSVDLGAPGTRIISTHPNGSAGYAYYSGTSMASPHVVGAVALCSSLDRSLTARQIRSLIMGTAKSTSSMAGKTVTGDRLDIGALTTQCAPPAPTPTPTPTPTPAPTPTPTPTPAPTPPPPGTTVYVDDLEPTFKRSGSGWKEGSTGYADHHYWVPTRQDSKKRYGAWRPVLAEAGYYEVFVKIPTQHATSRKATYKVKTSDGWARRVRSQKKRQGEWVSLGVHELTTTPIVQLADKTGEPGSLGRRLAFDAARFVPTTAPAVSSDRSANVPNRAGAKPEPRLRTLMPDRAPSPSAAQDDQGPLLEVGPSPSPAPEPTTDPDAVPDVGGDADPD